MASGRKSRTLILSVLALILLFILTSSARVWGDLVLAQSQSTTQQQPSRGTEIVGTTDSKKSKLSSNRSGKDHALLFATNDYDDREHWNHLNNPIDDARAIADELKKSYDFETELILNATRDEITQVLLRYRHDRKYTDDDQLLIFFAGHGTFIEDYNQGYIIARD